MAFEAYIYFKKHTSVQSQTKHALARYLHYWRRRKEGNVLFNDTLNTFYLRLYGVRHMVKDQNSEKGNPLLPHRLIFWLTARVLLYAPSHRQNITYHNLCYTSDGALAGTRNSYRRRMHFIFKYENGCGRFEFLLSPLHWPCEIHAGVHEISRRVEVLLRRRQHQLHRPVVHDATRSTRWTEHWTRLAGTALHQLTGQADGLCTTRTQQALDEYLNTTSKHNSQEGRKEGRVLFNVTLNTFSYGYIESHIMVKDHSDSKRGNLLLPHGLLFPISSKGSFICTIPQTR